MRIAATVSLVLALLAADTAAAATQAAPEGVQFLQGAGRLRARRGAADPGRSRRADAGRPLAGADDRDAAADARNATEGDLPSASRRRPRRPRSAAGPRSAATVPDFSGTNVQELGVDEPDVIKTDGRRIFAVTDKTLRVIAPGGARDRNARARWLRPPADAARRPHPRDRDQGRLRQRADRRAGRAAGRPAVRAPRSSPRSTSPARPRCCARWRSPGASSTRARTARRRGS